MKIKNVKVYGLKESIIRSKYPHQVGEPDTFTKYTSATVRDDVRAIKLAKAPSGSGHDNFLKGIIVQFDLQYPEYFSPQLQRYSFIDIISSQSKMHRITSRELTKDDFIKGTWIGAIQHVNALIALYNAEVSVEQKQQCFTEIIGTLPSGYLKWMGISSSYLQMKTIWNQRCKHKHKLDEWRIFGEFIQSLPMSHLITGKDE